MPQAATTRAWAGMPAWQARWWRVMVVVLASPEWGLLLMLGVLMCAVGMAAGAPQLWQDWRRDWGSAWVPFASLLLVPVAWSISELGRCLMWARWRDEPPRWQVQWLGICPLLVLSSDDVRKLRFKSWRAAVQLWGLLYTLALTALAWTLSRVLDGPDWQWVARAWMYAAAAILVCVHLNPFAPGAVRLLWEDGCHQPDLAGRSRRLWHRRAAWMLNRLSGPSAAPPPPPFPTTGWPWWVVWHAPTGWCAHWVATAWLVQQLAVRHPGLALLVLTVAVHALLIEPPWRLLAEVWRGCAHRPQRVQLVLAVGLPVLLATLGLFTVPWPRHLVAPGVIGMASELDIVAPVDARISAEWALDGRSVYEGQPLWTLQPLSLQNVDRDADAMLDAPGDWGQLALFSHGAGHLMWLLPGDPVGRVVRRGQVLAKVVPRAPPLVHWVMPAQWASALDEVATVDVRLAEQPERALQVVKLAWQAQPLRALPSRALGTRLGGTVAVRDDDPDGLVPVAPMIGLQAPLSEGLPRVGGRAWVRMTLAPMPLGQQAWVKLKAMWLAGWSA